MASEGESRPDTRDDESVFAPDETAVLEWSGNVEHDGGLEEALFAATEHRLVYVTSTTERIVDYTQITGVEVESETEEPEVGGYRDLAVGGVVFTVAGLGLAVWAETVIGTSAGVVGMLIGVLLLIDVLRNLQGGSGMMTIEATVEHIWVDRADETPLHITTIETVAAELRDLVAEARDR